MDESNKPITGKDILDDIYERHVNTVHPIKGLRVRTKIKTKSKIVNFLKICVNVLSWILKKGFGRTLDERNNQNLYLYGYRNEDFKKLNTDSFEIFKYKASRGIILIFCITVIFLYLIKYFLNIEFLYIKKIGSNQFLLLVHSILYLYVLDVIVPNIIFYILNNLIKLRTKLLFRTIKV